MPELAKKLETTVNERLRQPFESLMIEFLKFPILLN